jgi:aspartyl-tRNA(Asn)/glutamyl-tRNA(Gln) amidotransferase subunit A
MMSSELWRLGVGELAMVFARRETDPGEVIACYLERIARLDRELNAFTALAPDIEQQVAESAARLKAGQARSVLEGVPIAVKDNLSVAGMPAAWGSSVFADQPREADELPVRRLREAGAILLGKTNTPEFAVEGYTANARFGVTRNPWDLALTPGGSSGGSVAATAAGLCAAAIGTDGGGSIRRPAAHTGLYGLKPTIGSVSRSGGLPQLLLDFEVVGAVARSAEDLRFVYSALRGADRADPRSRSALQKTPAGERLRILYVESFGDNPCDPQIRKSVGKAADRLATLGHEVGQWPLPIDLEPLNAFWGKIASVGLAHLRAQVPGMASLAAPQYLAMADQGDLVAPRDFFAGLQAVSELRAAASRAFADWDLIMTPAAAAQPWPAEIAFPDHIDGQKVGPRGHAVFTGWVNASGHPAVAIPCEPAPDGMPIGFQLVGDLFEEELLLKVASDFEKSGAGWNWPAFAQS